VAAKWVKAPLIAECYASLECKVVDMKLVTKYNFFILEVVQAWIAPTQKKPRTIHHQGEGEFMLPGRITKLRALFTIVFLTSTNLRPRLN
jgi:flavin reductase (DIM6/NTAB) family NADH-FMN oxidoreductase RutF